jgi:hypothetical protein
MYYGFLENMGFWAIFKEKLTKYGLLGPYFQGNLAKYGLLGPYSEV